MTEDKKAAFDEIDTDGDGYITAGELAAALTKGSKKVSGANVEAVVKIADEDGDKKINFEEYEKLVR
ncbi:EF-hand domain-containing protein [Streptomyces sp. NPDC126514]|uniref:EF-hand domain-containing protein n=1 Tax=Streptomyces sp. NPDC126514 TaxID=3155210 RepID=UPI00331954B1